MRHYEVSGHFYLTLAEDEVREADGNYLLAAYRALAGTRGSPEERFELTEVTDDCDDIKVQL